MASEIKTVSLLQIPASLRLPDLPGGALQRTEQQPSCQPNPPEDLCFVPGLEPVSIMGLGGQPA